MAMHMIEAVGDTELHANTTAELGRKSSYMTPEYYPLKRPIANALTF